MVCVYVCVCWWVGVSTLKLGQCMYVLCTYSWFQRYLGFDHAFNLMLLRTPTCNNNNSKDNLSFGTG